MEAAERPMDPTEVLVLNTSSQSLEAGKDVAFGSVRSLPDIGNSPVSIATPTD